MGLSRKSKVTYAKHGQEGLYNYQIKNMYDTPNISDFDIRKVSEHYGVKVIDPFRDKFKLVKGSFCDWM